MLGFLLSLLVTSAAFTGALPGAKLPRDASNDAVFRPVKGRGIFGPISTDSPAGIAGGEIACGSPPVSSFFAGINPPVCKPSVPLQTHPEYVYSTLPTHGGLRMRLLQETPLLLARFHTSPLYTTMVLYSVSA